MIDRISYNEHLISKCIQSVHPVWWSICHVLVSEPTPQGVHTATQKNFTVQLHSFFFFIILIIACLFFSTIHFVCIKVCVCAQFCYSDVSTVVCSLLVHLWTTLDTYFSLKPSNDTKNQASGITDHEAWFYMLMYDLSTHCSCWGMCPSALFVLSGVH